MEQSLKDTTFKVNYKNPAILDISMCEEDRVLLMNLLWKGITDIDRYGRINHTNAVFYTPIRINMIKVFPTLATIEQGYDEQLSIKRRKDRTIIKIGYSALGRLAASLYSKAIFTRLQHRFDRAEMVDINQRLIKLSL